ncbi:MAG: CHASE2 domain-containing protein [Acidobacteriaceae bacterium]|nr:CHASE2 domain-containing protein [Acidobacteriaceae bacterium]
MPASSPEPSLAKLVARAIFILVLVMLAMFLVKKVGLLRQWEMLGVDSMLRSVDASSEDVLLVEIDNDNYSHYFNSTSPLDRTCLQRLIIEVARREPKVIVVDLDVSDKVSPSRRSNCATEKKPEDQALPQAVAQEMKKLHLDSTVIWAQTFSRPSKPSERLVLRPREPVPEEQLGIPAFWADPDGVIRRYMRDIEVDDAGACEVWPTLPFAAFAALRDKSEAPKRCRGPVSERDSLYIPFGADATAFTRISADQFLEPRQEPPARKWKGKCVLIGATFEAAREEYFTPAGPISGVWLNALALASEINDTTLHVEEETSVLILEFIVGLGISLWFIRVKRGWPIMLGAIAVASAAFVLVSYFFLRSINVVLSFMPLILGVVCHLAIDAAIDIGPLEKKVEELNAELHRLRLDKEELEKHSRAETPIVVNFSAIQTTVVAPPPAQAAPPALSTPPSPPPERQ